jgi:prepilin-type N-terminal cleavage/methylation domain-containing protein
MRTKPSAFTLLELLVTIGLFAILSVVLVATLSQVTTLWRRSSSHDEAVAQILKAKAILARDLTNSSGQLGQFATTRVGPSIAGSGFDGDALTFLSTDVGTVSSNWADNNKTGVATMQSEITYYLYVPNAPNPYGVATSPGAADGTGYEQQCAFKWLIRRVDTPANPPTTLMSWATLLPSAQPTSLATVKTATSQIQVIANQMFQFKVLKSTPYWSIQLSAAAVADATRKISLGRVPLANSSYTLVQQFTVPVNN